MGLEPAAGLGSVKSEADDDPALPLPPRGAYLLVSSSVAVLLFLVAWQGSMHMYVGQFLILAM